MLEALLDTRLPDALRTAMLPFRYVVEPNVNILTVHPAAGLVRVDPQLAQAIRSGLDLGLWVVGAQYLLAQRGFGGSRANTPAERAWEAAWALAHASRIHSLPVDTLAVFYPPQRSEFDLGMSLAWTTDPKSKYRKLCTNYRTWMEACPPHPDPPGTPLLGADTDHVNLVRDDRVISRGVLHKRRIPKTGSKELMWALTARHESSKFPSKAALCAFVNLTSDAPPLRTYLSAGHIGRRDIVRIASGLYTGFGHKDEAEDEASAWSVYLDVSLSMRHYAALAWSVVEPLGADYYAFSGVVVPASVRDDYVLTDEQTNYDAVAQHILASDHQHVLVISDDDATLSAKYVADLRKRHLTYVCIPKAHDSGQTTFRHAAEYVIDLPSE